MRARVRVPVRRGATTTCQLPTVFFTPFSATTYLLHCTALYRILPPGRVARKQARLRVSRGAGRREAKIQYVILAPCAFFFMFF